MRAPQRLRERRLVAAAEQPVARRVGAHDLEVRRDVAGHDRRAVAGGLEQGERQSLQERGQHEGGGVRVQLVELLAEHVAGQDHARVAGRLPLEPGHELVGEARAAGDDQPQIARQAPERPDQQVRRLLGHQPPQEQQVRAGREAPSLGDRVRLPQRGRVDAVRDPGRLAPVGAPVVLGEVARDHDGGVGHPRAQPLGGPQHRGGPRRPTSRARSPGRGSSGPPSRGRRRGGAGRGAPDRPRGSARRRRRSACAATVLFALCTIASRCLESTVDRLRTRHTAPGVAQLVHVVRPRVHDDLVAALGEAAADLLHVTLDPAERGRDAALPDHGDPQRSVGHRDPRARARASS